MIATTDTDDIKRAIAAAVAEAKSHGATPAQIEMLIEQIKARAESDADSDNKLPE